MSFEAISTEIIKDSINSAIYIDDKIFLPFEEKTAEKKEFDAPSDLYSSFRKNNCSLDFIRFNGTPIEEMKKSIFYNRDLLIMDWHLDTGNEDNLQPALELLEQAALHKNLHFCVIYTSEEKKVLSEKVIYNIASYFSGLTSAKGEEARTKFGELIDATGMSQEEIDSRKGSFTSLLIQLSFAKGHPEEKEIVKSLMSEVVKIFGDIPKCRDFIDSLSLGGKSLTDNLIALGFALNGNIAPEQPNNLGVVLSSDKLTIRIGNLFIKVFSKKDVGGNSLYDEFKKSLTSESNIFLTLLGLEIRSRFRESSAFISRELEGINHLAFFYHKNSHYQDQDELFNEFLKDIWKDQVASFLLEHEITLFDVLDEYKATFKIEEALAKFNHGDKPSREALARLNFVYNRLAIKRKVNDDLRFGDVFFFEVNDDKTYLMCLTPHCDCLRPGKIKNMFFFVEGKEIPITDAIKKGDGDYISYVKNRNGDIICIDWTLNADDCKPFTLYVPDNKIKTDQMTIDTNVLGEQRSLLYLTTIKENYAQRIANKAFFYPLRVGIDFASFPKK